MKSRFKREQIIAAVATALLFISLLGTGYYHHANSGLKGGLDKEKLRSESLLSEKLALTKEAEKLKNDISTWMGKSRQTDQLLTEALSKITGLENNVRSLRRENAGIAGLKSNISQLEQIRQDLENKLAGLENINAGNEKKLSEMTAEIASLRAESEKTRFVPVNLTDNFRVESLRGRRNNRLTVNAKRTRKLVVSFEIPQSMSDDIQFAIETPGGKIIKSDSPELAIRPVEDGRTLIASLSPLSGEFEISRRLEMTYSPSERLESGVYKIDIFHKDKKTGTCQLRLK